MAPSSSVLLRPVDVQSLHLTTYNEYVYVHVVETRCEPAPTQSTSPRKCNANRCSERKGKTQTNDCTSQTEADRRRARAKKPRRRRPIAIPRSKLRLPIALGVNEEYIDAIEVSSGEEPVVVRQLQKQEYRTASSSTSSSFASRSLFINPSMTSSSLSSNWPWMEGVGVVVADPIHPVSSDDKRPSVKALIEKHRAKINKIRAALQDNPLFVPSKHDDLWILRFYLSHKKSKPAIQAAIETLKFRQEYNLDAKDIRSEPPHKISDPTSPVYKYWNCRMPNDAFVFSMPDPRRGIVGYLRMANVDQHAAMEHCTEDDWKISFVYKNEWCFQMLDYVTRTTGRLTRSVRFVDMGDITKDLRHPQATYRDTYMINRMECCYPQLVESVKIVSCPKFMHAIWTIIKPLMPARIIAKGDLIEPAKRRKDLATLFPFVSKENIPECYGGLNKRSPSDW